MVVDHSCVNVVLHCMAFTIDVMESMRIIECIFFHLNQHIFYDHEIMEMWCLFSFVLAHDCTTSRCHGRHTRLQLCENALPQAILRVLPGGDGVLGGVQVRGMQEHRRQHRTPRPSAPHQAGGETPGF